MNMNESIFWQEEIERKYNRKHIDRRIREEIDQNEDLQTKIQQGVELLEKYRSTAYTYYKKDVGIVPFDSKNRRVAQIAGLDIESMVRQMFIGVAYCVRPVLFTSITAQMASRLKFSDKRDAIATVAEMLAVLCLTDAFDIFKQGQMGSLELVSRIPLSDELMEFVENSEYLPPMICPPKELTGNYSSGYLTHTDSLVLGSGNHHEGDLCLDVLNTMNNVALTLDVDFLRTYEEEPTFIIENQDQADQWRRYKAQSARFYMLMVDYGNRFYLTHKVDKRGRIYAQGYHITTQGTAYKKAAIELAHKEFIEVPEEFK